VCDHRPGSQSSARGGAETVQRLWVMEAQGGDTEAGGGSEVEAMEVVMGMEAEAVGDDQEESPVSPMVVAEPEKQESSAGVRVGWRNRLWMWFSMPNRPDEISRQNLNAHQIETRVMIGKWTLDRYRPPR
jgi:hypothetical protein